MIKSLKTDIESKTIVSFGNEWQRFDQSLLTASEAQSIFDDYFRIFPWECLPDSAIGFDMGCGTGRWAHFVSQRVAELHCVDPSDALEVARKNLACVSNVVFYKETLQDCSLGEGSFDFGYSLGVLHHMSDTEEAIRRCTDLLRAGAPLLLYLYYNFENRSYAYFLLWKVSNVFRLLISKLPERIKSFCTDLIAIVVYWPISRFSFLLNKVGFNIVSFPLAYYRNLSLYTLRTDARDRFGTPLEKRFSRKQITRMLESAGLERIKFSDSPPYWCVVAFKTSRSESS